MPTTTHTHTLSTRQPSSTLSTQYPFRIEQKLIKPVIYTYLYTHRWNVLAFLWCPPKFRWLPLTNESSKNKTKPFYMLWYSIFYQTKWPFMNMNAPVHIHIGHGDIQFVRRFNCFKDVVCDRFLVEQMTSTHQITFRSWWWLLCWWYFWAHNYISLVLLRARFSLPPVQRKNTKQNPKLSTCLYRNKNTTDLERWTSGT